MFLQKFSKLRLFVSFVSSNRELVVFLFALGVRGIIILAVFVNNNSIFIQNALFIFDILENFVNKTIVFCNHSIS